MKERNSKLNYVDTFFSRFTLNCKMHRATSKSVAVNTVPDNTNRTILTWPATQNRQGGCYVSLTKLTVSRNKGIHIFREGNKIQGLCNTAFKNPRRLQYCSVDRGWRKWDSVSRKNTSDGGQSWDGDTQRKRNPLVIRFFASLFFFFKKKKSQERNRKHETELNGNSRSEKCNI